MKNIKINDCCDKIKKALELLEYEKESIREEIDFLGVKEKEVNDLLKALNNLDKITKKLEKMIGDE